MSSSGLLAIGEVIHDRYKVERLLGQGAFGATYLVRDEERFGEACALKELQPHDPTIVTKARELFEREARVLLAIKHEQIPALHAYFEEQGRYYLVQGLVDGSALNEVIQQSGPWSEQAVRRMMVEVLGVLDYLHGRNPPVLHRDIKPSNLILDSRGRINVIDFGAVREALESNSPDTVTTIGTPGYAPIEQALGKPVPASDLHALGMTALFLLSGRGPNEWRDRITGAATIIGKTGASPDFERFLARLVADLPHRFESARQATAELQGEATQIGSIAANTLTVVASAPAARPGVGAQPARTRAPSWRRWAIGAVVAVVPVLGVWRVVGGKEDDAPTVSEPSPAEALDREATLTTPSRLELSVRHPSTWQVMTSGPDGHIGLQDSKTQSVFVAGLDSSREPVLQFARQWALRMSRKYGRIELSDEGTLDQASSYWRFQITLHRSTTPERGMFIVEESPPTDGEKLNQWWALLGQTDATIPTALAMANSLNARASPEH